MKSNGRHVNTQRSKPIKGFDEHRNKTSRRQAPVHHGDMNERRAMAMFTPRGAYVDPKSPHFRFTARTFALPGNHIRVASEPLRAAHCRTDD